jgi:hypothetical protein
MVVIAAVIVIHSIHYIVISHQVNNTAAYSSKEVCNSAHGQVKTYSGYLVTI